MFGDVFGTRSDYSKGIIYGSRRKYLHKIDTTATAVEPPQELMSRKQARHAAKQDEKLKIVANMCFGEMSPSFKGKNKNDADGGASTRTNKSSVLQKSGKSYLDNMSNRGKKRTIVINKYSTLDQRAWTEEIVAGCRLYTNKDTGEVSRECPWQLDGSIMREKKETRKTNHDDVAEPYNHYSLKDDKFGTGSLVYDSSVLDNLFQDLDKMKMKNKND